jgi:dihydrolipoamide dehydrogenase
VDTSGKETVLRADVVLVATGAAPRTLPTAQPDGERILTWEQVYDLDEVPSHLVVVGSGVTGAELASAYLALGIPVTLVSSRDRVLPGEDADAAAVLEDVLTRRGMSVLSRSRMASVERHGDSVVVTLTDGRTVEGSHCILALGSVPKTSGIGLEEAGVHLDDGGFVQVDRVSRTTTRGVYSAGDCTGVLMLASVAAMQGRIAMWHALGDAVAPLDLGQVSSNVFTSPEIATVGWSQRPVDAGEVQADQVTLPLAGNARAKMQGVQDGFVKLFCRPGTGVIEGGVIVAPRASELIHPVTLAVAERLTADQLAHAFTVYPSMSGSVAEAARRMHRM